MCDCELLVRAVYKLILAACIGFFLWSFELQYDTERVVNFLFNAMVIVMFIVELCFDGELRRGSRMMYSFSIKGYIIQITTNNTILLRVLISSER